MSFLLFLNKKHFKKTMVQNTPKLTKVFFSSKNSFPTYYLPKTPKKYYKKLVRSINSLPKPKTNTKQKIFQNLNMFFLGVFNVKNI